MVGLFSLVAICVAGIAFMGMFFAALWRDGRPKHTNQAGKPYPKLARGKLFEMPSPGNLMHSSVGGKRKWVR